MTSYEPRDILPGVGVILLVALISFMVSFLHPSFDALVISIILGVLVSSILDDKRVLEKGIEFSIKIFLPLGIALYGSQLVLKGHNFKTISVVVLAMLLLFLVTYFVSKAFGLGRTVSALMGTGMAVCGASAIVIVAPLLGAKKEETSISVLSVMTVGLTGMLCYRFAPDIISISAEKFALLTGLTLPMVGQVKVASLAMDKETSMMAMNYKLARMAGLIVFTGAAFIAQRMRGGDSGRFPWFLIAFYAIALAVNFTGAGGYLRTVLDPASKFLLTAALAAIGLSVDVDAVSEKGPAPIMAAFLSAGIAVMTIGLFLGLMR